MSTTTSRERSARPASPTTVVAALALIVGTGCASSPERTVRSEADLQARAALDAQASQAEFRQAVGMLLERAEHLEEGASAGSAPPTMDFLAISGGGDWGAFGAGFLVGWGLVPDPKWRRPNFDVVTGVSTGALLAPFAFVGTDEACHAVETFYRNPKSTWVRKRSTLFFLPSNPSFMIIPGLEKDIRSAVDAKFVGAVADQARTGKVLVVSATNLDLGRQRFWNLGTEAQAAVASGNNERVCRMLLASAAIPAVFPPVQIDDFLYGDGGSTANVLLRLDPATPDSFFARWRREHPDRPFPKVRYWILFNNQMIHAPETVQERWPAVITPSLETSVRHATIAEIRWLAAQADYVNSTWHTDIEVRVACIPDDWRPPVQGTFKKETMRSLADLGRKMGADPKSWTRWGGSPDVAEPEPASAQGSER